MVVNELLQKQWESEEILDMKSLLRVARRGIETTRDQLDVVKINVEAKMESQGDRVHAMEVGFAQLNEWAEKMADRRIPRSCGTR